MCSDSESAGGSSESRSMDSPTASPGRAIQDRRFVYGKNILLKVHLKLIFSSIHKVK